MSVKSIQINSSLRKALLVFGLFIFLFFTFLSICWFLGNSVARGATQLELARFAVDLAPSDPRTHFSAASFYERTFLPEDLPKSLAEYENSVALSPNDYLLWLAYARAKSQNGDSAGAVKALEKAYQLAPHYASVRWAYGNALVRQGNNSEGFELIRKAVEQDSKYAAPAAATAWGTFQGDIEQIKKAIGDSTRVQAALADFVAGQERYDEALQLWNTLPENERRTNFKKESENLYRQFVTAGKYRAAASVLSQTFTEKRKTIAVGKVTNGGFELDIELEKPNLFEWKLANGKQPVIGISNDQKYAGDRSLALVFNSPIGRDFRTISQVVAVESQKEYTLEVFCKSALETNATVKWEIADQKDKRVIASTDAVRANSDWTNLKTKFTTGSETEAVIVRLVRETCTTTNCSIRGKIWFDGISLK